MKLYRVTSWGYLQQDVFDGMMGYMENKQVEIGATAAFVRKERLRAADFTVETWTSRSSFIFRHPQSAAVRTVFLQPLSNDVWVSISICSVLISSLLWLALFFENIRFYKYSGQNENVDDHTLSLIIVSTLGALSQQGFTYIPQFLSCRMIIFWTLLSSVLIYQFYSASIVSSLLMKPSIFIKTLKDLVDSTLDVGIEDIPYNRDFFNKTMEPIALALYNNKMLKGRENTPDLVDSFYMDANTGLDKVAQGGYAFHGDTASIYPIVSKEFPEHIICELAEVPLVPIYFQRMAIPVRKGSPYKKIITFGLRRLVETGIMKRLLLIYDHGKPPCGSKDQAIVKSVEIESFYSALCILFIGMLMSMLILMIELLWVHKCSVLLQRQIRNKKYLRRTQGRKLSKN